MNCPKCSQPVEPGAAFCGNCGQPIQTAATPPPSQPTPVVQPQQATPSPQAQPAVSPVAQVMASQTAGPQAPAPGFNTPVAGTVGTGGNVPAYAMPNAAAAGHSGETKAIIGLVLGVIAIPAALIPILGLGLGIAGLVLGTLARSKYKRLLSLLAIIFSILAILISLGVWIYAIESLSKSPGGRGASGITGGAGSDSSSVKAISTPCYTVQIDTGLNNYTPTGCNFDSADTGKEYTVQAMVKPEITADNLQQYGKVAAQGGVKAVNGTIVSERSGQFAGSPAYIASFTTADHHNGVFGLVLHQSANEQNLFFVAYIEKDGTVSDFGNLEKNWQWK